MPDDLLSGGRAGWPAILSSLKSVLETGKPLSIKMEPPKEMMAALAAAEAALRPAPPLRIRPHLWLKRRMGRALTVIAVFGVTVALLFARAPDAFHTPQFWAEDAVVFWVQQYEQGFFASLLRPSAGYLHVMPRLIAALTDFLPYQMHPAAFVAGAADRDRLDRRDHCGIGPAAAACGVAGVAALLVVPGGETLTNPTNVQWIMAPALPLIAAAASPAGGLARANQLAFVALSGLSGPFSILMIPIWLWRVLSGARRDAFALVLAATTCLAGTVQALILVGAPETLDAPPDLLRALWVTLLRAVT